MAKKDEVSAAKPLAFECGNRDDVNVMIGEPLVAAIGHAVVFGPGHVMPAAGCVCHNPVAARSHA